MPILVQHLYAIGAFQGLVLAGLLILGPKNTNANRILGTWCLFLAVNFLGSIISISSLFSGLSSLLPAAYGAFLYLYCRHAIIDAPFKLNDLWHFLPLLACYLLNLQFFFSKPSDFTFILVAQFILFLQAFIYFGVSTRLIRRYQIEAKKRLSSFNPEIFNWLWKLLILDLIIWCLKTTTHLFGADMIYSIISDLLILLFIYSISMAQWRNPNLFKIEQFAYELEAIESNEPAALQYSNNQDSTPQDPDSQNSDSQDLAHQSKANSLTQTIAQIKPKNNGALDPEIRSSLLNVVRAHMKQHQTFLNNQLTLTRLAEAVDVSTHHLSEVLNQHGGKNFYQFVNEYRIDYVCQQMKQDHNIKIIDLALTAGFSSKSTFNAVFKQFTNLTPSQYRKNIILN